MVRDHLGQPAAGHGVQHPEAAVVGVGVLQGAPQVHFIHGGKPCPVQGTVGFVQLVVIRALHGRKGLVGFHPPADQRPLLRGALGREIPQDAGFHGGALIDQLLHNLPVQPGDGGTFVGHDLHQPVFLQPLQDHPDEGTRCSEPGAARVFTQRRAGADGQVNDLPLQHSIDFSISFVLFHTSHLMEMHYSSNGFQNAPSGSGSVNAMGFSVSGCKNCRPQLCRAMLPFTRLPYLPSPVSGCFRDANCVHLCAGGSQGIPGPGGCP